MLEINRFMAADPCFAQCFAIRLEVFVQEQNVPEAEERDEFDDSAWHFLALNDGAPAGTARVILLAGNTAKITRVAVTKPFRGLGIGIALMRHIEQHVTAGAYVLDAQTHAVPFYRHLGYETEGREFQEAGMPHFHMRKVSRTAPQVNLDQYS